MMTKPIGITVENVPKRCTVLGIGNILLTDDGVGVRVIEKLREHFEFDENISIIDGGVMGVNLVGVISEADHVLVADAVNKGGKPGALYRLEGDAIPKYFSAKTSLHQVGFPEIMATCQILGHIPDIVVFGVEPADIETCSQNLTPAVRAGVNDLISMILAELDRLGARYRKRNP